MKNSGTTEILRLLFALTMMAVTFVITLLAIFVPLLLYDMHIAPHDGQGGIGGALIGLPLAALCALLAGPFSYVQAVQRHWFKREEDKDHEAPRTK